MPLWNERFTIRPAAEMDARRPLGKDQDLRSILSQVDSRVIGPDYTLRYGRRLYQVAREQIQPRLRGQAVRVEQHLDGCLVVPTAGGELKVQPCALAETITAVRSKSPES